MSVLFYPESIRILGSDASGNNVMLCEMAVDDIANLPAANAFISDGYVLSMGCVATAINDNSKHRLNGSGNWVQIAAGTSTYTRAEIDAFLSVIDADLTKLDNYIFGYGTALSSGDDLNDLKYANRSFSASGTISVSILNSPWTPSGFTVWTIPFIAGNNFIQILIPNTSGGKWYKRRYFSGQWGVWTEYDGNQLTQGG